MSKTLSHAIHNFELCKHLHSNQKGKFNDWVITTAFYSALHYLHYKAFPLTKKDGKNCKDIFSYRNSLKENGIFLSKHETNIELVRSYLPEIFPEYKRLYDSCNIVRYTNYNASYQLADLAYKSLLKIKKICENK